ncbi:MFS transporter [Desulfotalea psychrophila]|uniref:Related to fosmidomycin resistance protein n=1 Tax=Desulfotalea psychrophila (strain LSv54 / DSM 12343) TaxID=177439 RepID=Q6APE1_DESPS|nr:MFS transporter [Desulfotalea psychrophila]CAG35783.1 related to fosmidomycin resistance protein [Desulfotalea psychrophila LSv54]
MNYKKFRKSDVFTISAAHMLHDTYSAFLAPLLPLLIEKLGMSLSTSALLEIARRIPTLFNPFFGLLAEKTEVKYFVIFTPAITAIAMSLIGLASSYTILFILLFVSGISSALFHVPSPVMVKEASGNRIGTGMSWFMVGGESARTIGPLLVTAAVSLWGLEGIYKLMPLGLVASFILYLKLKDFDFDRPVSKAKEKGDTRKLLKRYTPFFTVLASYLFFQAGMKSALTLYLPVYLISQGESLWHAGFSLSILQFFGVLGAFFAGNLSDRIGRKNTLVITSIGSALCMGLFIHFGSIYILAFLGLFLLSSGPVLMASVQDTNTHMPTFMNSIYMTISFSITSLVVFAVGLSGDNFGLETTYIICNVFAIGSIPFAFLLRKFL